MHDVVDAKDCSNVVHSKWKHRLHQGCFLSRDEEVSRRLVLGGEARGGLAEVDFERQEVNTARMARCCFYCVQTKASWLHVFTSSCTQNRITSARSSGCNTSLLLSRRTRTARNFQEKTKTCSSSLVSLMTPAQSLPSMGENADAATDTSHCEHPPKIHKRTQVKQTETSLVFTQTRDYEIRTRSVGKDVHASLLPAAEGCAIAASRAPRGLLPAQLWGFSNAPPHNACRTALLFDVLLTASVVASFSTCHGISHRPQRLCLLVAARLLEVHRSVHLNAPVVHNPPHSPLVAFVDGVGNRFCSVTLLCPSGSFRPPWRVRADSPLGASPNFVKRELDEENDMRVSP